jgi:hypothetical protein
MPISYATPGSPCPVFVAGIKYRSIDAAAIETGISFQWLYENLKESDGAPVVVKNQCAVLDFWVQKRIEKRISA